MLSRERENIVVNDGLEGNGASFCSILRLSLSIMNINLGMQDRNSIQNFEIIQNHSTKKNIGQNNEYNN